MHQFIILGGAQLGLRYGITNRRFLARAALYELLDKARYLGFRTWDLAQAYGCAEQRVAMWRQARRDRSLVFGSKLQSGGRSLVPLDYILRHSAGPLEPLRSLYPGQRIGLSLYYPSELEEFLGESNPDFQVLQLPYSVADRRFEPYFARLGGVELQLRSLYLQGLLLVNDVAPYARKYPALAGLAPLLAGLGALERRYVLLRQDLLLYAGLRHIAEYPLVRLVLGVAQAAELLDLHYSLRRIAAWPRDLRTQVCAGLERLPQPGPEIVVPLHWS